MLFGCCRVGNSFSYFSRKSRVRARRGCGRVPRQHQHRVGWWGWTSSTRSLCREERWVGVSQHLLLAAGPGHSSAWLSGTVGAAGGGCARGVVLHLHLSSLKSETPKCRRSFRKGGLSICTYGCRKLHLAVGVLVLRALPCCGNVCHPLLMGWLPRVRCSWDSVSQTRCGNYLLCCSRITFSIVTLRDIIVFGLCKIAGSWLGG